jgi:hypothetical protein
VVAIDVHEGEFHVYDQAGERQAVILRTSGQEVTRTKGYGVRDIVGEPASPVHAGAKWFSVSRDRIGCDHRWDGEYAAGDDRLAAHGSG